MNQTNNNFLVIGGIILTVGLTIGIIAYFLRQNEAESRTNIDQWAEERIAKNLAEKLNQSSDNILQAIRGSGNRQLITEIQEIFDYANLTFTKVSSVNNIELRLDLYYQNGTSFAVTTNWDWDTLPEAIRSEFIRTGNRTVIRPWQFTWDN